MCYPLSKDAVLAKKSHPARVCSGCRELSEDDILEDGCYVYGLFIDGARWNPDTEVLDDQLPGVIHDTFPLIRFQPCTQPESREEDYNCPLYKTMARAGVLSSTGGRTKGLSVS